MQGSPTPEPPVREGELESLMERYQQSDQEAAALLVKQVSPQIYRFYLGQVRDRDLAEDLLQDFWLRIHHARHTYRPREPVLPWLYAIARRTQIDDFRRRSRINRNELPAEDFPEPRKATEPVSSLGLRDLLKQLPAAQREVLIMLKVNGLSLAEIARATGSTVGAVKQKAHRAYETLRKTIGGIRS